MATRKIILSGDKKKYLSGDEDAANVVMIYSAMPDAAAALYSLYM